MPVALEALYGAEESYGARPVSGFADAPGRRDDIVAYADSSNLVTRVSALTVCATHHNERNFN